MVLDARLAKLARGVTAAQAARAPVADAHVESVSPGDGQAAEFEAILEAMFLMAAVDGEVSEQELEQLRASIQAIADLHVVQSSRVAELLDECGDRLANEGWHARLASIKARIPTPEGRAFAFRLAGAVAFVDDHVAHAEAAAIDALAAALELPADESQAILREVADELFGRA
jgi:tellurite resistance protein